MAEEKNPIRLLITALFCLLFVILFVFVLVDSINLLDTSLKYEDLIYKEFTIQHVGKIEDQDLGFPSYVITVEEESKKIKVNNLVTIPQVEQGLDALRPGYTMTCYLIEKRSHYECVELKCFETILSLEQYNNLHVKDGRIVIIPISLAVTTFLAVKFFIEYIKETKKATKIKQ